MSIVKCKNCATDIPTTPSAPDNQLVICPSCATIFKVTGEGDPLAIFRPSTKGLPPRMSIKVVDDELIITRRWFSLVHLGLAVIASFLLIFGLFFSELATAEFLFNPLTWLVLGLDYYALTWLVNRTVVAINPERLMVKQGPLPPRRNSRIDAQDIRQLYVKQRRQRSSKTTTITYQVYLTLRNGQPRELVSGLETPEQALFLEQEIERYLGITDQPVSGEHESSLTYDFSGWGSFASANNLHYTPGKLLEGHRVEGNYQGYAVELIALQPQMDFTPPQPQMNFTTRTRLTLAATERVTSNKALEKQPDLNQVTKLFAAPLQATVALTGKFKVTVKGEKLIYEEDGVETDETRLQLIFDTLYNLIEAYPRLTALGSQIIPRLQPVANDKNHPAQAVAAQLIQEIGPTTEHLGRQEIATLLCPRCLVRCAAHKVEISWLTSVTYFGCRRCHQSRDFLTIDHIIALLDNRADAEPVQQGRILTANWLPRQTLFDFDAVEIIRATDEEVERFAVQVGNDTDPVRRPHYQQLSCAVSPDCNLSDNTRRILRRTFGQVELSSGKRGNSNL